MNNTALIILDGLGMTSEEKGNAIFNAKTPNINFLLKNCKSCLLQASGEAVGLPWGEMGNSEVGHTSIGAGRIILQDYPLISRSIENGEIYSKKALVELNNHVKKNNSNFHIIGLTSTGGVHSHIDHILAMLDFAKKNNIKNTFVHIITDGRDSPPQSALEFISKIESKIKSLGLGKIATIIGRYFAMDRDKNWDRTQKAYELLTQQNTEIANDWKKAIKSQYDNKIYDEFLEPITLSGFSPMTNNDGVIFVNFRSDRAIQLTRAIIDENFEGFNRLQLQNIYFASMTLYQHKLNTHEIFNAIDLNNSQTNPLSNPIGKIISDNNITQSHIAESEKFAHVTYFFNSGEPKPFNAETQIIVESPKVKTYDLKPEMSINEICQKAEVEIRKHQNFILINFANCDMVGHSGNFDAAVKATEFVDDALAKLINLMLENKYKIIVTADHGNAEQMINPQNNAIDKEHTVNPVPFVLVENISNVNADSDNNIKMEFSVQQPLGILADISPTILNYLDLGQPSEMTGQSLKNII